MFIVYCSSAVRRVNFEAKAETASTVRTSQHIQQETHTHTHTRDCGPWIERLMRIFQRPDLGRCWHGICKSPNSARILPVLLRQGGTPIWPNRCARMHRVRAEAATTAPKYAHTHKIRFLTRQCQRETWKYAKTLNICSSMGRAQGYEQIERSGARPRFGGGG